MYNAFHSGWSLEGDRFFYPNPLALRGVMRQAWFACACCPPNVCRFVPSLPGYAYAVRPGSPEADAGGRRQSSALTSSTSASTWAATARDPHRKRHDSESSRTPPTHGMGG